MIVPFSLVLPATALVALSLCPPASARCSHQRLVTASFACRDGTNYTTCAWCDVAFVFGRLYADGAATVPSVAKQSPRREEATRSKGHRY